MEHGLQNLVLSERWGKEKSVAPGASSSCGLLNELNKIITDPEVNLHNDEPDKEIRQASLLVKAFLYREDEYRRVTGYMIKGWENEQGDIHFQKQRKIADDATVDQEKGFYYIMIDIANEMEAKTSALSPPGSWDAGFTVLDICMAPGGFSAAVIKQHPRANIYGLTLPSDQGGHHVHLPGGDAKRIMNLDITILRELRPADKDIPKTHPEYANFVPLMPFKHYPCDLVFADGIVLRNHKRGEHRQDKGTEVTRLICAQLILALTRIKTGGTLIMLLHKLDTWQTANLLYTFSKFSNVELFKPRKHHKTRSSFYMIAKNIDEKSEYAQNSLRSWRENWYKATFGGEERIGERMAEPEEAQVVEMLADFGAELVEIAKSAWLWKIQADALSKTTYAGGGSRNETKGEDMKQTWRISEE